MTSALASAVAPSPPLSTSALPITSTPTPTLTLTLISTLISTHLRPLRLLREACRSFVRELYVFALSEWAYSQVSRYVARSVADTRRLSG